jgi:hypothetical protein
MTSPLRQRNNFLEKNSFDSDANRPFSMVAIRELGDVKARAQFFISTDEWKKNMNFGPLSDLNLMPITQDFSGTNEPLIPIKKKTKKTSLVKNLQILKNKHKHQHKKNLQDMISQEVNFERLVANEDSVELSPREFYNKQILSEPAAIVTSYGITSITHGDDDDFGSETVQSGGNDKKEGLDSPRAAYRAQMITKQENALLAMMQSSDGQMARVESLLSMPKWSDGINQFDFVKFNLSPVALMDIPGHVEEVLAFCDIFRAVDADNSGAITYDEYAHHIIELANLREDSHNQVDFSC